MDRKRTKLLTARRSSEKYSTSFLHIFKRAQLSTKATVAAAAGRVYGFPVKLLWCLRAVFLCTYYCLWIDCLRQSIHSWEASFGPAQYLLDPTALSDYQSARRKETENGLKYRDRDQIKELRQPGNPDTKKSLASFNYTSSRCPDLMSFLV